MSSFTWRTGGRSLFNDPRRFGFMKIVARERDRPRAPAQGPRSGAARQRIRRGDAGARLRRQEDVAEGGAARSARRRRPRQYLRLRGAASRASVAAALGLDACDPQRAPTDHARRLVSAIRAVLNDAIQAGGSSLRDHRQTNGELGYFQHRFGSMTARGKSARRRSARAHQALHAERPLDLLVPGLSEMTADARRYSARRSRAAPMPSRRSLRSPA